MVSSIMEEMCIRLKLIERIAEVNKKEAAIKLFQALKVYPTPKELMSLYDRTVPKVRDQCSVTWIICLRSVKVVLDTLAQMVAYDHTADNSSTSSSAGVE